VTNSVSYALYKNVKQTTANRASLQGRHLTIGGPVRPSSSNPSPSLPLPCSQKWRPPKISDPVRPKIANMPKAGPASPSQEQHNLYITDLPIRLIYNWAESEVFLAHRTRSRRFGRSSTASKGILQTDTHAPIPVVISITISSNFEAFKVSHSSHPEG
jgi:hypothetical protein